MVAPPSPARRRRVLALLPLALALSQAGCFGYSYHSRGPAPTFDKIAIDYNQPHSEVRWSYVWGLFEDEWAPIECREKDTEGKCVRYVRRCDAGVGRVEARLGPYSVPLMVLTLGMVVPVRVTAFCATHTGPVSGP